MQNKRVLLRLICLKCNALNKFKFSKLNKTLKHNNKFFKANKIC